MTPPRTGRVFSESLAQRASCPNERTRAIFRGDHCTGSNPRTRTRPRRNGNPKKTPLDERFELAAYRELSIASAAPALSRSWPLQQAWASLRAQNERASPNFVAGEQADKPGAGRILDAHASQHESTPSTP